MQHSMDKTSVLRQKHHQSVEIVRLIRLRTQQHMGLAQYMETDPAAAVRNIAFDCFFICVWLSCVGNTQIETHYLDPYFDFSV
jgi:hypothetical protein